MKKHYLAISSVILLLVLSFVIFKIYSIDNKQQNVKFRTDVQQDAQVKTNEAMISKSLENITNSPNQNNEKNPANTEQKPDNSGLSNSSGDKPINQ